MDNKEKLVEILKDILPTRGMANGIPIIQKWNYGDVADKLIENGIIVGTTNTVEVVRCRDCKHKGWKQEPCHGKSIDVCRIFDLPVDERFYCGCGERKESSKTLSEPTRQAILDSFMKGSED